MVMHHRHRLLLSVLIVIGLLVPTLAACTDTMSGRERPLSDCPPLPLPGASGYRYPFNGYVTFTASCGYGGEIDIFMLNVSDGSIVNLTHDPADEPEFSWSPDGELLAFASNRAGNYDIYVLTIPTGQVARLTDNLADDRLPSWSPDGAHIAFVSYRDTTSVDERGELYVMQPDGSKQQKLSNNAVMQPNDKWVPWLNHTSTSLGSWSPDGKQFATDIDYDIYIFNLDQQPPIQVTRDPAHDQSPLWSPDGRHLAFLSNRDGYQYDWTIFVVDLQTHGVTRLSHITDLEPRWSPDGRHILFADRGNGNDELYIIDADGQNKMNLTKNGSNDFRGEWSSDGEYIAFLTIREGYKLFVMKADGTQQIGFLPASEWERHTHSWRPHAQP